MQRREFVETASRLGSALSVVSIGLAGCISQGHRDPGYVEGYLDSTNGWENDKSSDENIVDKTDAEKISISVGVGPQNHSFRPVAVEVSLGTTVVWKWTGESGKHNVVSDPTSALSLKSGPPKATGEFKHTFTENKTLLYYSKPHLSDEMKGAVTINSSSTEALTDS